MERTILIVDTYEASIHEAIAKLKTATGCEIEVMDIERAMNSLSEITNKVSQRDIIAAELEQLDKMEIERPFENLNKNNRKGGLKNKRNWRY